MAARGKLIIRGLPRDFAEKKILLCLFLLNIALALPLFFPALSQLGDDEAVYIQAGRLLHKGVLPVFALNPLSSGLYGALYLPLKNTAFWLVHAAGAGRFIIFLLLWTSCMLIARRLKNYCSSLAMAGVFLASPVIYQILYFPADSLFAALSGFTFWQWLGFCEEKKTRSLAASGAFIGLAALARSDGIMLLLIVSCLTLGVLIAEHRGKKSFPFYFSRFLYLWVPFILIVGGYLAGYSLKTGKFEIGLGRHAYIAFAQGEGIAYADQFPDKDPFSHGYQEAEKLYGSAEANHFSMLKAIQNNPSAYLKRVRKVFTTVPSLAVEAYGGYFSILLFLLCLIGAHSLQQKKQRLLLFILLFWPLHLSSYFLYFFRPGYFLLPYFILFTGASIGLTHILREESWRREGLFWLLPPAALVGWSIWRHESYLTLSAALVLLSFFLTWLCLHRFKNIFSHKESAWGILLITGFLLCENYPAPGPRTLGKAPDEQAVLQFKTALAPNSVVAAYNPAVIWCANMTFSPLLLQYENLVTEKRFKEFIAQREIKAFYLDARLQSFQPATYDIIAGRNGKSLKRIFSAEKSAEQILLVPSSI